MGQGAGWTRYAKFSVAKTVGEAFRLGAMRSDISYHAKSGRLTLERPVAASPRPAYDAFKADAARAAAATHVGRRVYAAFEGTEQEIWGGSIVRARGADDT